jgi:hypothetical protein
MIVGQVSNLPLLPNFSCLFLLVYPVGRLETCPTTKSTVPMLAHRKLEAYATLKNSLAL